MNNVSNILQNFVMAVPIHDKIARFMAWIESHQDLERHPKVADLMAAMDWDLDTTIGKLHRFWWWCVDYAEDGDLRKHNDSRIAQAMGVATADATRLKIAMVEACWLDRTPYFRVHDWWDYVGRFLHVKYGKSDPDKIKRIRLAYSVTVTVTATELTNQPNQPTNQPERAREVPAGERMLPTLEMAKGWLVDWNKNGADYNEDELRTAFLALQANGWMWGKNPVVDFRAALERQIQTDRTRNERKNSTSSDKPNPRNPGVVIGPTDYGKAKPRAQREREAKGLD